MPITPTVGEVLEMIRLRHHGKPVNYKLSIIQPIIEGWETFVVPSGIADNPRQVSHFISQIAHETDHFKTLTEYADGKAYNGRANLGNTQRGDGPRFKGRGYLQLTGRAGYRYIGEVTGHDLEGNPGLAAVPNIALQAAVAIWRWKGLMGAKADGDHPQDVENVTRAINGGMNGYEDRLAYYRAARRIWTDGAVPSLDPEPDKEARKKALIAELEALTGATVALIYN